MSKSEFTRAEDSTENADQVEVFADVEAANDPVMQDDDIVFLETSDEVSEDSGPVETAAVAAEAVDMATLLDDPEKAVNGVWKTYRGKTRVKVARAGNTKAQALLAKLYTANRDVIDLGGEKGDQLTKRIYLEVEAKCIALDFEHMEFDGMVVQYTPKNAMWLLKNSKDFRDWLTREANKTEDYTKRTSAEDIDKAKKLLSGN